MVAFNKCHWSVWVKEFYWFSNWMNWMIKFPWMCGWKSKSIYKHWQQCAYRSRKKIPKMFKKCKRIKKWWFPLQIVTMLAIISFYSCLSLSILAVRFTFFIYTVFAISFHSRIMTHLIFWFCMQCNMLIKPTKNIIPSLSHSLIREWILCLSNFGIILQLITAIVS